MAPQSKLEAKLKKAQAKIKKLEERKDQELEALKRVPNIRDAVFGMTFAGLTFAYKEGVLDLLPRFFFQFGTEPADIFKAARDFNVRIIVGIVGPLVGIDDINIPADIDETFRKQIETLEIKRQEAQDELAEIPPGVQFEIQRTLLRGSITAINKKIAQLRIAWRNHTLRSYLIAMGLAGATMLFLMETSTSEVMDIGAKALDAVTPIT